MTLELVEKFFSIHGEAPSQGSPVYIIRFSGCNLDCVYCDTVYRDYVAFRFSEDELFSDIQSAVNGYPGVSVMFTGGEPLLRERQDFIYKAAEKFRNTVFYIETNGSQKINDFSHGNIRFVVDWKTPSSGFESSFYYENLPLLRPELDCIKIVTAESDLPFVYELIHKIRIDNKDLPVYLSPVWGAISFELLADFIVKNRLNVSMSIQMHKIIWGEKRGV